MTHTHVRTYIANAAYACTRVCMDAKKDLAFEIPPAEDSAAVCGAPQSSVLASPLRSTTFEVIRGHGWALWTGPGSRGRSLPESAADTAAEACGGGQRGRHSERAEGRRARAPTRAPPRPLPGGASSAPSSGAASLPSGSLAEPAPASSRCSVLQKRRVNRCHPFPLPAVPPTPPHIPKVWADCKSFGSGYCLTNRPPSPGRGARGHVAEPGPGAH